MSVELGIEEIACLKIINESSASGGQYLLNSNIACAVVCMITSTKKVSDKNVRDSMISKVVKQYIYQGKVYSEREFTVFAKYAIGGVPPGLDSTTLIEMCNNVQAQSVSLRTRASAIKQSETLYEASVPSYTASAVSYKSVATPSGITSPVPCEQIRVIDYDSATTDETIDCIIVMMSYMLQTLDKSVFLKRGPFDP
ncbi:unnamed protein product [Euphydryas editha]|uniref:Coat protein n=1 Tax=Euphydryas editha TaxID=104508 RepID=A0AAU9TRX2_EUPED|nr:unnamed protein product [Euphydryas editha]